MKEIILYPVIHILKIGIFSSLYKVKELKKSVLRDNFEQIIGTNLLKNHVLLHIKKNGKHHSTYFHPNNCFCDLTKT